MNCETVPLKENSKNIFVNPCKFFISWGRREMGIVYLLQILQIELRQSLSNSPVKCKIETPISWDWFSLDSDISTPFKLNLTWHDVSIDNSDLWDFSHLRVILNDSLEQFSFRYSKMFFHCSKSSIEPKWWNHQTEPVFGFHFALQVEPQTKLKCMDFFGFYFYLLLSSWKEWATYDMYLVKLPKTKAFQMNNQTQG